MHHKFSRSFCFHGEPETTRAPCALIFSVRPSCVGWRRSRLQRSTLTATGMRSSNRRATACIEHPAVLTKLEGMDVGEGATPTSYSWQAGIGRNSLSELGADFVNCGAPWLLANCIHDSTAVPSTPPEAHGKIGHIQSILIFGSFSGAVHPGFLAERESGGRT
jgi:hypothetical protein